MLSIPDMALLGAAALLLFGPEQLPRVARKAGNVMREIQNTSQSFIREMERAADVQDEAEKKPYEPPPYDPTPYDATAYEAPYDVARDEHEPYEPTLPFDEPSAAGEPASVHDVLGPEDAPTVAMAAVEPPAPDPGPPVGEKLAEPRPALHLTEPPPHGNGAGTEAASPAAQPAPQGDHPAHL
ncbi:MAG TPA: twin-arginine translocase TatA/TatE family subunit [Candidatus Elarobacter sp.]|jgi:sec-independent protein translocase protein TatA|nr:twin-arginine translocase TatA/TatE family subunit [Candidatus Elarobacter sp.]